MNLNGTTPEDKMYQNVPECNTLRTPCGGCVGGYPPDGKRRVTAGFRPVWGGAGGETPNSF